MNAAKLRALDEMMGETERAVAEFKEDCETELTSRDEIKSYVMGKNSQHTVNDMHLTHAIRRAKMVNAGRRIRAYGKQPFTDQTMENRFSVVIVRGDWTIEAVKQASTEKLLEAMGLRDWLAMKPPTSAKLFFYYWRVCRIAWPTWPTWPGGGGGGASCWVCASIKF